MTDLPDATRPPADNRLRKMAAPRLYALAMVLRRATNAQSKRELGLAQESARIMILLGGFQPLTLNDLALRSTLDRGQLSRGVSELERQGLVSRERRGRNVMHRLTETGEEIYTRLSSAAHARNEFLLRGVSAADREHLFRLLDLMIERAHEMHEIEKSFNQKQ